LRKQNFQDKCVPKLELGNEETRRREENGGSEELFAGSRQQLKCFVVAAALEEMAQFRIDLRRQGLFEALDLFGDFAKTLGVAIWIGAALLVADDSEAFAEGGGEVG
jgi:hypothetical protein